MSVEAGPSRRYGRFWILAPLCGLAVAAIAISPFDGFLSGRLRLEDTPGDLHRSIQLLEIFGHGTGVWVIITGWLALHPRQWRNVITILAGWLIAGALVQIAKGQLPRYRPAFYEPSIGPEDQSWEPLWRALAEPGWQWNSQWQTASFPSGHSATAFALATVLATRFPRGRWYFLTLALIACLQRILAHAHWASDVLAGAAIGVLAGAMAIRIRWTWGVAGEAPQDRELPGDGGAGLG